MQESPQVTESWSSGPLNQEECFELFVSGGSSYIIAPYKDTDKLDVEMMLGRKIRSCSYEEEKKEKKLNILGNPDQEILHKSEILCTLNDDYMHIFASSINSSLSHCQMLQCFKVIHLTG